MSRVVSLSVCAVIGLLTATPSMAASEVTRTRILSAADVSALVVTAQVGDVRIEQGDSDAIVAKVTLKAKRTMGVFSSLPDVSILEMSVTTRGDQLRLGVDAKNVEERWLIRMPRKPLSAIEVKAGVGSVTVAAVARRIEVDLGVGDATVDVPSGAISVQIGTGDATVRTTLANAGAIDGKTGVGRVSLSGLDGTINSRAVGGSVSGKGRGQEPINAMVGVGDLSISLQ
ncbi:MAG: DUF4097 domain-containing protein [Sinobacteraceae bacterium]|nr:DUF4097 domain-containing protein [Nevskiaceae bacterium]